MLSDVYRSQGKEKEAEALLKDSIRFGPHFADAYSSLASLYAEQVTQTTNKNIHTCITCCYCAWKAVVTLFSPFWLFFVLPQKRFSEANEVYLKGIENCPDSSDLHNNYGVFLVDTGESNRFPNAGLL